MIRWFLNEDAYDTWWSSLPLNERVDAIMYTHVGHVPSEFKPDRCTACALNQSILAGMGGWMLTEFDNRVRRCRHDVQLDQEDCDAGC